EPLRHHLPPDGRCSLAQGLLVQSPSLRCADYCNTWLRRVQAATSALGGDADQSACPTLPGTRKLPGRFGTRFALAGGAEISGAAGDAGDGNGVAAARTRDIAL